MTVLPAVLMAAAGVLCQAESDPHPAVVVELFTSQGCSSCPPADRWLGSLVPRYGSRVIPLSLHVGYWDYIGWKDPFARREFNERQQLLAASGSRSVYTPGVFVQGREFSDWRNASSFEGAVRSTQGGVAVARVGITVESVAPAAIEVRARVEAPSGARLWLALVQSGLTTAVGAGENRGQTLHNDHVVRDWQGPLPLTGVARTLRVPEAASDRAAWSVVALVDDAAGRTLQAVRLPLDDCRAGTSPR
ncbi:MAG TPA: DUF1223 domain-containing protein [Burkholderiaceae bacterium]|nr:DUF1223 domain-containing protein [Burkholderiaceae bacterium]